MLVEVSILDVALLHDTFHTVNSVLVHYAPLDTGFAVLELPCKRFPCVAHCGWP